MKFKSLQWLWTRILILFQTGAGNNFILYFYNLAKWAKLGGSPFDELNYKLVIPERSPWCPRKGFQVTTISNQRIILSGGQCIDSNLGFGGPFQNDIWLGRIETPMFKVVETAASKYLIENQQSLSEQIAFKSTLTWNKKSNAIWSPRKYHATIYSEDSLFISGGLSVDNLNHTSDELRTSFRNDLWRMSTNDFTWTQIRTHCEEKIVRKCEVSTECRENEVCIKSTNNKGIIILIV